jgi:hypothetical protein
MPEKRAIAKSAINFLIVIIRRAGSGHGRDVVSGGWYGYRGDVRRAPADVGVAEAAFNEQKLAVAVAMPHVLTVFALSCRLNASERDSNGSGPMTYGGIGRRSLGTCGSPTGGPTSTTFLSRLSGATPLSIIGEICFKWSQNSA